jgi:hypothetical protein
MVGFGCGADLPDGGAQAPEEVIGGRVEKGYPAVGYLRTWEGQMLCGATLIAPNRVVTAAHCVHGETYKDDGGIDTTGDLYDGAPYADTLTFSLGAVGTRPQHHVISAVINPLFYPSYKAAIDEAHEQQHDVAVLTLDFSYKGIVPAVVSPPIHGCEERYVGYGRTTPGDRGVMTGYTSQRKSALECVDHFDEWNIWSIAPQGGSCYGDSGGPLMVQGTRRIVGVLSTLDWIDTQAAGGECYIRNHPVFTNLTGERDFLACGKLLYRGPSHPEDAEPVNACLAAYQARIAAGEPAP